MQWLHEPDANYTLRYIVTTEKGTVQLLSSGGAMCVNVELESVLHG